MVQIWAVFMYGKQIKQMIMDHPVTGVGPGLWQKTYREHYKLKQETQDFGPFS